MGLWNNWKVKDESGYSSKHPPELPYNNKASWALFAWLAYNKAIIRLGGPYLPDLHPKLPGETAPIVFAGMFSTLGTTLPGFSRHKVNLFYQVKWWLLSKKSVCGGCGGSGDHKQGLGQQWPFSYDPLGPGTE